MSLVIQFTPKCELSPRHNLDRFIALARDKLTLWSDQAGFSWAEDRWTTTYRRIRFTNFEHADLHPSVVPMADQLMHPVFVETAKAYIRYTQTLRPSKIICRTMRALRTIEFVLRQDMGVPDITKFRQRHWSLAVKALESSPARQYICSSMLDILKTLAKFHIISIDPRFWRNPYVGRHSYDSINGSKALNETKEKKLPNQDALIAIAEVFSRGASKTQEDTDVMVTCVTALLLSAPMRIGETLRFRTDCLREDEDRNGVRQHYLAYWVPKTREFSRKPIPKTMAEIAAEAVRRLHAITEEGRALARYMETSPSKFYRHANCPDIPDDQVLKPLELVQAMGLADRRTCESFIKRHTGRTSLRGFTLNSLWQLVLAEHRILNPHFPYQEAPDSSTNPPLKMSESLLCFRRNQLAGRPATSLILLAPFNDTFYTQRLTTGNRGAESMNFFSRHNYKILKLKSHSLRHLLNRLGRASGISVDMLTEWSSRASTLQTRTYLHDDLAKAASKGALILGTPQVQEPQDPVTNMEAELYDQGPHHRSRYGICRRSWRAGPCNKFADCLNCSELLMCKGDKIATKIIQEDRDNLSKIYMAAQQAIANGERSATRWTEKAGPQIERLDQLLSILNNPQILDGSPIQIAGEDFSHERVIVSEKAEADGVQLLDRKALGLTYGEELLACLDLLRDPNDA